MKLSILIPTLNEPESINFLRRLNNILDPQIQRYQGQVEKVINDAPRSMSTGTKRNLLIANSEGDYFVQIDNDDLVPPYYVDELMRAIEHGPDVVTFIGHMTTNGRDKRDFTIKLGSKYEEKNGHYHRFPNHLCCYKRSVVEHVKFPDIWVQEDYQWALRVQPLLKTEIHINKHMYTYDFRTKPNQNKYLRTR